MPGVGRFSHPPWALSEECKVSSSGPPGSRSEQIRAGREQIVLRVVFRDQGIPASRDVVMQTLQGGCMYYGNHVHVHVQHSLCFQQITRNISELVCIQNNFIEIPHKGQQRRNVYRLDKDAYRSEEKACTTGASLYIASLG